MSGESARAPAELVVSGVRYLRSDDLCAVALVPDELPPPDARLHLKSEGLVMLPVDSPALRDRTRGPVYRAQPGGQPVVPTGRMFARLAAGRQWSEVEPGIGQAGFVISPVPAGAVQAGWLQPQAMACADALARLGEVRALPGVESVEPQLLRVRSQK